MPAEFESETPYFYSTYEYDKVSIVTPKRSVVVLGSGPIRIGQGVEFDYATVHSVWAIKEAGYEAIIINSNPERSQQILAFQTNYILSP